jgi:hypothetical protein
MSTVHSPRPEINPDYPTHKEDGTRIDYSDDPTGWIEEPVWSRKVAPLAHPFDRESDADEFLDPDTDFSRPRQTPIYDVVFERPLVPGKPVELIVLDGGRPLVIGIYKSMEVANEVAYRTGTFLFALRSVT